MEQFGSQKDANKKYHEIAMKMSNKSKSSSGFKQTIPHHNYDPSQINKQLLHVFNNPSGLNGPFKPTELYKRHQTSFTRNASMISGNDDDNDYEESQIKPSKLSLQYMSPHPQILSTYFKNALDRTPCSLQKQLEEQVAEERVCKTA